MPVTGTRLPSLTALRWIAALAVFARHGRELLTTGPLAGAWSVIADAGSTGVSFFFILSGFVLAWTAREGDTVRAFLQRRVARIVPAYVASGLLALFMLVVVAGDGSAHTLAGSAFSFTLLQAWVPVDWVYWGGNLVGWSLSVEAFFYVLFPFIIAPLVALCARHRYAMVAAALAWPALMALIAPRVAVDAEWFVYINPLARVGEFVLGIALCRLVRSGARVRVPIPAAVAFAAVSFVAAAGAPPLLRHVVVTVPAFALLIVVFAQADLDGRRTVLWSRPMQRLGEWSYAFYLVHAIVAAEVVRQGGADAGPAAQLGLVALTFAVSLVLSFGLYRAVEQPLERRLRQGGVPVPVPVPRPGLVEPAR